MGAVVWEVLYDGEIIVFRLFVGGADLIHVASKGEQVRIVHPQRRENVFRNVILKAFTGHSGDDST